MEHRLQSAFGKIHAEDSLKASTLAYLQENRQGAARKKRPASFQKMAAAFACLLILFFSGTFSFNLYFTEAAFVDLDINPSLSLSLNRFDRVVQVNAYNADAEAILLGLNLKHKKVDAALENLMEATALSGYLQEDSLVSVTVQTLLGEDDALLAQVQDAAEVSLSHHGAPALEVYSVDSEVRTTAHNLHMSPAKYLAILDLQEVDPSASVEECRDHSISELKELTRQHGSNHRGAGSAGEEKGNAAQQESRGNTDTSGHHGNRH